MTPFQAQQLAAIDDALTARMDQQAIDDAARVTRVEACPSFRALREAVTALANRARPMPIGTARTWILGACESMAGPCWIGGLTGIRLDLRQALRLLDVVTERDAAIERGTWTVLEAIIVVERELARKPVKRTGVEVAQAAHASAE